MIYSAPHDNDNLSGLFADSLMNQPEATINGDKPNASVRSGRAFRIVVFIFILVTATVFVIFQIGKAQYFKIITPSALEIHFEYQPVDQIELSLQKNAETELTAILFPNTARGSVEWSCENSDILTVEMLDANSCELHLLKEGTAAIVAKCGTAEALLSVTVVSDIIEFPTLDADS